MLIVYIISIFISLKVYIDTLMVLLRGDSTPLKWHIVNFVITFYSFWNLSKISEPYVPGVFLFLFVIAFIAVLADTKSY